MAAVEVGARTRLRAVVRRHATDLLLAGVVALVVLPVLQPLMAQQISRYALTASLHDTGTVDIEEYRDLIGVDRAERDGVLYSDKAPGQPVLAIPAYAVYRLLGGAPGTEASVFGDLGLWATSLVSAGLPAVALALLMRRLALRCCPARATEAALALSLSTMLLPFGTLLFSHVLSALCGLGAYLLATREGARWPSVAAAGAVAGFGVTVEYTLGVLVLIIGVAVLAGAAGPADALRRGIAFAAGGAPLALLLGWYHHLAFGGPFEVGYRYSQFAVHGDGIVGVRPPDPTTTLTVLFGERGLFLLTPIALVGCIGIVALLVRGVPPVRDAWVALFVVGAFVSIMGGWSNPWAGASPGPRYITPALPFLAGGVAHLWARRPAVVAATAIAGGLAMGIATFTLPLAQPSEPSALLHWIDRARDGRWADTLLTGALGDWAIAVPLVLAAALGVVLMRRAAAERTAVDAPSA